MGSPSTVPLISETSPIIPVKLPGRTLSPVKTITESTSDPISDPDISPTPIPDPSTTNSPLNLFALPVVLGLALSTFSVGPPLVVQAAVVASHASTNLRIPVATLMISSPIPDKLSSSTSIFFVALVAVDRAVPDVLVVVAAPDAPLGVVAPVFAVDVVALIFPVAVMAPDVPVMAPDVPVGVVAFDAPVSLVTFGAPVGVVAPVSVGVSVGDSLFKNHQASEFPAQRTRRTNHVWILNMLLVLATVHQVSEPAAALYTVLSLFPHKCHLLASRPTVKAKLFKGH